MWTLSHTVNNLISWTHSSILRPHFSTVSTFSHIVSSFIHTVSTVPNLWSHKLWAFSPTLWTVSIVWTHSPKLWAFSPILWAHCPILWRFPILFHTPLSYTVSIFSHVHYRMVIFITVSTHKPILWAYYISCTKQILLYADHYTSHRKENALSNLTRGAGARREMQHSTEVFATFSLKTTSSIDAGWDA